MATLYTNQSRNIQKTWMLMILFLVFITALGYFLSYVYNNITILYVAVFFSVAMNFFSYYNSDKIAISASGAHLADENIYKELHRIVENLAITSGLPKPKVFIIDDQAPNAFATGRDKEHASIAVTTGLLEIMDRNELEGVIAHELSHIGNRDILLSTIVVTLVGSVAILSDIFLRGSLFRGRDRDQSGGAFAIIGIVLVLISPIVATLIKLAISRKRELLADSSGALLTRYPEGLANALKKIDAYGGKLKRANPATAHLFIANPFGKAKKSISGLFLTHPPVAERVAALLQIKI